MQKIRSRRSLICTACVLVFSFFLFSAENLFAAKKSGSLKGEEIVTIVTPVEKERRPRVQAPKSVKRGELFMVSVQVGEKMHPSTKDHSIEWIEAAVNGEKVFHLTLYPALSEPRFTFPLRLEKDAVLKVEAHCSKYGSWGTEVPIRVRS